MKTVELLFLRTREQFPLISAAADRIQSKRWDFRPDVVDNHAWFEALAGALNANMCEHVPYAVHEPLFHFMASAYAQGSDAVRSCIDTAFLENLFWQIASVICIPYWDPLPVQLQQRYLAFHGIEPGACARSSGAGQA